MAGSDRDRPEAGGAEPFVPEGGGLTALRAAAPECRGCELWRDATQVVFSSGRASARLVLVGEQPGDREDREGEPFIGPAGHVLDDALAAAGIARADVYLTNAVKHFRYHQDPRGKRRIHDKPAVSHIVACHPWLSAELRTIRPRVVVCLGATAARSVLGRTVRIAEERGRLLPPAATSSAATSSAAHAPEAPPADATGASADSPFSVLVTTHPSALLRLRGEPGWDEAFDGFVADLETAARAAG